MGNHGKMLLPAELLGTQCEDCVKKEKVECRFKCTALKDFYFLGKKPLKTCFAFEGSKRRWTQQLKELENHLLTGDSMDRPKRAKLVRRLHSEIIIVERGRISGLEARRMFFEESHKPGCGGAGEGQDRTHKLFPESRMKDNRYIPPWGSEGGSHDRGRRYIKKAK